MLLLSCDKWIVALTARRAAQQTEAAASKPMKGAAEGWVSASAALMCLCVSAGAQLHHLAQVGLSSRLNGYPAGGRAPLGQNGGIGWNHYHDENFSRTEPEKEVER